MTRVLLAFQFLTIVPVEVRGEVTARDIAGSAAFFPLVGAFQGLLASASVFLMAKLLPADIIAGIAVLVLIASNGGFDLDGLADTADALAVKSSGDFENDRTKRLSVMKDSSIGAMGVIALTMAILLKFILMRTLISGFPVSAACSIFFLMPVFSKWVTVPAMRHGRPARKDGLGAIFIENIRSAEVIISTALVILLCLASAYTGLTGVSFIGAAGFFISLVAAFYLFGIWAVNFFTKRFGGLTGDNLGAATEVSEILFLFAGYIWLRHSIS